MSQADAMATRTAVAQLGPHTPEGFVASIWQHAQSAARELGVDARALVAQAALETGWGKRHIRQSDGSTSHNLFGIKATGWSGQRVAAGTHEYVDGVRRNETASFRAYSSPAESFADYVRLLKTSPRYQQALQAGTDVGLRPWPAARQLCHRPALCGQDRRDRPDHRACRSGRDRRARRFASTATAALGITVVEEPHVQRTFHRYRCPARLPACVGDHQPQRGQPQRRLQPQKVNFATADPQNYGYGTVGNGT